MFRSTDTTLQIRQYFRRALTKSRFTVDRAGHRTLELLGAHFVADKPAIFGKPNEAYIARETAWYDSMSLNVNDMGDPPTQWCATANDAGEINSNYGYLVYSARNGSQYQNVLAELRSNPDSRRATMIYTRPSMWRDHRHAGKNDFVCTNAVTYYVRDDQLHCVVQMRSNDVVYGYKNDRAWQKTVLDRLSADLQVQPGRVIWQVQNLHVYERHFGLIR